ncbi:MAG TPA: 3-phosphoshikimate 1-carboxyvinyltransferase [Candidatus Baltobacteraceae bacterium]
MSDLAVAPAAAALRGRLTVPGDKSIAHRALLFAALASGPSRITGLPSGHDVRSTRRCLEALGITIADCIEDVVVEGRGGAFTQPPTALDCGNSGTTMRLLSGILSTKDLDVTLDGDESLRKRPMRRIATPLTEMGATIELAEGLHAPIRVRGTSRLQGFNYELTVNSAQVKGALIFAALNANGPTILRGALRSRDHSERMLPAFGGTITSREGTLQIEGRQHLRASPQVLTIPGDISSAAYWIASATIVPNSRVEIAGVGLNPTRLGFVDVLRRMGASITLTHHGAAAEPIGTIVSEYAPLRATVVEGTEVPDLVDELPLLAIVASFAEGTTHVRGAEELRYKESDRIDAIVRGGRAIGMQIEPHADGFSVTGPASLHGGTVDAMRDHRIAMAFAIAGLGTPAPIAISGADSVAISYPDFFSTLDSLRG